MQETPVRFLSQKDPWRRDRLHTPVFLGFPCGSAGEEFSCRRSGFDHWIGKILWRRERLSTPVFWPGEFHGLYSPWGCKELAQLSNFHFPSLLRKSMGHGGLLCLHVCPDPNNYSFLFMGEKNLTVYTEYSRRFTIIFLSKNIKSSSFPKNLRGPVTLKAKQI